MHTNHYAKGDRMYAILIAQTIQIAYEEWLNIVIIEESRVVQYDPDTDRRETIEEGIEVLINQQDYIDKIRGRVQEELTRAFIEKGWQNKIHISVGNYDAIISTRSTNPHVVVYHEGKLITDAPLADNDLSAQIDDVLDTQDYGGPNVQNQVEKWNNER